MALHWCLSVFPLLFVLLWSETRDLFVRAVTNEISWVTLPRTPVHLIYVVSQSVRYVAAAWCVLRSFLLITVVKSDYLSFYIFPLQLKTICPFSFDVSHQHGAFAHRVDNALKKNTILFKLQKMCVCACVKIPSDHFGIF